MPCYRHMSPYQKRHQHLTPDNANDSRGWRDDDPAFQEADNLVEALVRAYLRHAERALARGLLQGYQSVEDAQPGIRGRVREADQLRRRFGLPLPVEVRYDDYTTDIDENRLLRAAARRLGIPGAGSIESWHPGTPA